MVYETTNGIESKICCRDVLDMLEQRRGTIVCSSMLFCIDFGPVFPGVTFLNGSETSRIFIVGLAGGLRSLPSISLAAPPRGAGAAGRIGRSLRWGGGPRGNRRVGCGAPFWV